MKVQHNASPLQLGKIPCPFCSAAVPLELAAVLKALPLRCPACNAEFAVNSEKSRPALAQLTRWSQGLQQSRAMLQSGSADAAPVPRKARSRDGQDTA